MPPAEQDFYSRFVRRVNRMILALALAGSAILSAAKGVRTGLAFLVGALVSYASFWGWRQVVDALTPNRKRRWPAIFVIRILLVILIAYGIIKLLGLNVAAAAMGLLVSAAAMILALIFELIYART